MSSSSTTDQQELFHLDIHAWVKRSQQSHGVRHDDFGQYHAYCTRRLSRLSHKPDDAKAYLVHSSKYASSLSSSSALAETSTETAATKPKKKKTAGGRHAFCSRSHDTFALTKEVEVEIDEEKGKEDAEKEM